MRIAPRNKLCGSAWRGVQPNIADRVEELRELCAPVGDNASLVIGMTALAIEHMFYGRMREASRLASEQMALLETIDDPTTIIWGGDRADLHQVRNRPYGRDIAVVADRH